MDHQVEKFLIAANTWKRAWEGFVKNEVCLLYSNFVCCMEKFRKSSVQRSNFHAYKILHASNNNFRKVSGILKKTCERSVPAQPGQNRSCTISAM